MWRMSDYLVGYKKEAKWYFPSTHSMSECCLPLRFRLIFRISAWRLNFKNCRTFLNWIYDSIARNACEAEYQPSSWYEYSKYRENVSIIRCCHNTSTLNNNTVKVFSYSLIPQVKEKKKVYYCAIWDFISRVQRLKKPFEIGFHEVSAFSIYMLSKNILQFPRATKYAY